MVEKLHFQSRPGLYVTGNLYLPKNQSKPAPAILYVCGHGNIKQNGISYGSKVASQQYGPAFARLGYACLIIDTLQLGEIEGIHHGLYREKMWWWQSRGYTPAGVEAWNSIRAIDYLCSRPEVDKERIGITGRSGGGAYSWWTAALDTRVKCAVPTAGITDMEDHVVNGCVEGHCDCMYFVNTYRWDFAHVAALVSPRALLIANSDKDSIFPLEGVMRVHALVRDVYKRDGAEAKFGILVTEGPHKDTQDLQTATFRWFNRFLKNDEGTIDVVAKGGLFQPEQLRVHATPPADQLNTKIQESFVPTAPEPKVPGSKEEWAKMRDAWIVGLKEKVFGGWPEEGPGIPESIIAMRNVDDTLAITCSEFVSQKPWRLRLYVVSPVNDYKGVTLHIPDENEWPKLVATLRAAFPRAMEDEAGEQTDAGAFARLAKEIKDSGQAHAFVAVRGVGRTAWKPLTPGKDQQATLAAEERRQTHVLRRFGLVGQTLDGMRVYDIRGAIETLQRDHRAPLRLEASGRMAALCIYASLFEQVVGGLDLHGLPTSHRDGPELLNVLRVLDMPAAVAVAAERCPVKLQQSSGGDWTYPRAVAERMGWGNDRVAVLPK
jgi:dienelactone hydrolase